jgi:hypothetical protein
MLLQEAIAQRVKKLDTGLNIRKSVMQHCLININVIVLAKKSKMIFSSF